MFRSARAAAAGDASGGGPQVVELQPEAFAKLREEAQSAGNAVQCIDVREEWEHQTASLAGFQLRPLSRMAEWCAARGAWRLHDSNSTDGLFRCTQGAQH